MYFLLELLILFVKPNDSFEFGLKENSFGLKLDIGISVWE